jgi:uncharacterized protein YigE (DUF2233 family)
MIYPTTLPPTATSAPTATPSPIPTSTPNISPTIETIPDTGWFLLQPGLERRMIRIYNDQNQHIESLYIWRLDQDYFQLDVAYQETPQSLESWQQETDALLVVNGGYFRVENERYLPNGLTIVNGQAFGSSYESFAGMLAITDSGAELRWLAQKPYNSSEPLRAALQSFPLLVKPGGELGFSEQFEDNVKARRTVIGQDKDGNLLFIVAPQGHFTLHQLSLYLIEADLSLDIALNLDGGPSTGILVANPQELIPSQVLLPFVILVYTR